jgi:transposase
MTPAVDALPDDPETLKAMLIAERIRSERLVQILKDMQRHRFGRRAETLSADQLLLALEDVEQSEAETAAETEAKSQATRAEGARKRRANRGALPPHLPRIETVIDVESRACPCCRGELHRIGEDVSEKLDVVPAQFRVLVVRRPKYACRACEDVVIQAPAPARLIEGGLPTEATVAHVLVAKYADHLPLYRQAQIYERQGIQLDRSTLADWVGRAAFHLRPIRERILANLRSSAKLFADETTAPVLDPGRGRTKTGQLWAYARDDRPWGGTDPPAVAYVYAPDRTASQPIAHLSGFKGVLQVDGYAGYRALAQKGDVSLAFCRVGGDVTIPAPHRPGRADYPHPVLHAQASLRRRRRCERAMVEAADVARAWRQNATTTNCCGDRVGRAISSKFARVGGDTNGAAGCCPRCHSRRSAPGSCETGGRAARETGGAGFAGTIRSRRPRRARNGLSPLSGAPRPCLSATCPRRG